MIKMCYCVENVCIILEKDAKVSICIHKYEKVKTGMQKYTKFSKRKHKYAIESTSMHKYVMFEAFKSMHVYTCLYKVLTQIQEITTTESK